MNKALLPALLGGLLLVAVVLDVAFAQDGSAQDDHVAAMFSKRCASCHTVPDVRFATDRAWMDRLLVTAWSSTPPRAREALRSYLSKKGKAKDGGAPIVVDAEEAPADNRGFVTTNIAEGEVFLRRIGHGKPSIWRLTWTRDAKARKRALPAGEYLLTGFRVARKKWFISTTGGRQRLMVTDGETTNLDLSTAVILRLKAFPAKGGVNVQAGITGHAHMGLSVYQDGARIPLRYRLEGRDGAQVAAGVLTYGWGGGAWASARPKADALQAVLSLPDGVPFKVDGSLVVPVKERGHRR